MSTDELRFQFGHNWKHFVAESLNDERIAHAVSSVQSLLGLESLAGRTFLDIGCGSGLFSLAATRLGADRVISFDFDPESVETARKLRDQAGASPTDWRIEQGSVLDPAFMAGLPRAEVVYSWGVLHHTGRMWDAVDAAIERVTPGGLFAMSIYNKVERKPDSSAMWWKVKRLYNRSPAPVRGLMETAYVANYMAARLVTLRNPVRAIADGSGAGRRGMDFRHDVRDWLGGFPYEYASAGEIFEYVHSKHALRLERLRTCDGNACNEFVFSRPSLAAEPDLIRPSTAR
jgi:2-polyprenyl-6-hydroxyphenyl methylase/3-demethylubiquinone-9 3-methyltransferase